MLDFLKDLIVQEQRRQHGLFIEGIDLEAYLEKIDRNAEIITHIIRGECAGFVVFYCNDTASNIAFITLILVSPQFRGAGVATELLSAVFSVIKKRGFKSCDLQVKKNNTSAISLYENKGFRIVRDDESSYFMTARI